ncbi:MAG: hypothetical protein RMM98_02885 [Acidobacteriota bacterium]|nr:hypothetical protein [Blastocatellia bacterium]MDW8238537.1 hypothetical protein [Acidobacteriota bacterium]
MERQYGEIMNFLLDFRGRFQTDEDFRQFLRTQIKMLVDDLRDFSVFITLQPESISRQRTSARGIAGMMD